ncbi:MAG TPA: permease prefix domain 1-containing protein [Tepidisphaeraceae bacterium]|jgi:hypothetical protein|nr:permease prefix domain 1-containing protein [Tepidisphaeraceae bacterium]
MKSFDEVVERLTERLKVDPELRAEVKNELRGHLEESAREFVKAGRNEEEAQSEAVRALGEEKEVAAGLWEGNKRRVSNRRVARWVVGGSLVSAAGVGTVAIAWGAVISLSLLLAMLAGSQPTTAGEVAGTLAQRVARYASMGREASMSGLDRQLFEAGNGTAEERLEKARKLAEEATGEDQAIFWANYATQALAVVDALDDQPAGRERLEGVIAIMEKARQIEPANAYYAMVEASLLMKASTKYVEATEEGGPGFDYRGFRGKPDRWFFDRYDVVDAAMYERGIAKLRLAAQGTYLQSHAYDFTHRRLKALGMATSLADEVIGAQEEWGTAMPYLNVFRNAINGTQTRVFELAAAHRVADAMGLIKDECRVSGMMAASAKPLVEFLVARGMYLTALGQEAEAYQVAGDAVQFKRSVADIEGAFEMPVKTAGEWRRVSQLYLESGLIEGRNYQHDVDPPMADPTPERRAEYAVADQMASAIWAGVMMLAAARLVGWAIWQRVRGKVWPMLMFIGWGRLAWVLLMAVVVPVGVYVVYIAAWPVSGRWMGMGNEPEHLIVEYASVGCVIVMLLRILGERALMQRGREIGHPWQGMRAGRGRYVLGVLLALMVVSYLIAWHMDFVGYYGWIWKQQFGYLLATVVLAYGVSWLGSMGSSKGAGEKLAQLPSWLGPVVVAGMLGFVISILDGDHSYRAGRLMTSAASEICLAIVGLIGVVVLFKWLTGRHEPTTSDSIGRWSLAPVLLGGVVVLMLAGGMPARLVEKREVRRIAANGGLLRIDREVELSSWKGIRDRMVAETVDGVAIRKGV